MDAKVIAFQPDPLPEAVASLVQALLTAGGEEFTVKTCYAVSDVIQKNPGLIKKLLAEETLQAMNDFVESVKGKDLLSIASMAAGYKRHPSLNKLVTIFKDARS